MTDDLKYYIDQKSKLEVALRDGVVFASSYSGHVGIINQGSTCYLNSLIQCLFYNLHFRAMILHAKPNSAILAALQETFCYLQLSESSAVNTKDLVAAFGWSRGQVFEQHDVHELFNLLLDALSDSSTDVGDEVSNIFRGSISDVLLCPSCGHKRESQSAFLNISLELSTSNALGKESPIQIDSFALNSTTNLAQSKLELVGLLELHMQAEILDADNKWECSGCVNRVQALKYHEYKSLPPSLMIHLKRLRYNTNLNKREKVTTPVYFPCLLDTSALTSSGRTAGSSVYISSSSSSNAPCSVIATGEEEQQHTACMYRLHSVLLHTGTANGGHYKAYVLHNTNGRWLECDDSSVSELSSREEASLFLQKTSESTDGDVRDEGDNKIAVANSTADSLRRSPSGESAKKFVTLRDNVLRENAYMLLYRKIPNDCLDGNPNRTNSPICIDAYSEGERLEAESLTKSCEAAVPLPMAEKIREENVQLQELRRLYQMHKKIVPLKIMYSLSAIQAIRGVCSEDGDLNKGDLRDISLLVFDSDSLNDVLSKVCTMLSLPLSLLVPSPILSSLCHQEKEGDTVSTGLDIDTEVAAVAVAARSCLLRLRGFSQITGRKGTTYGARTSHTIADLRLHLPHTFASSPPVVLLLESRGEGDPPFCEVNDQAMMLRMLEWSAEVKAAITDSVGVLEALGGLLPASSDGCTEVRDTPPIALQGAMREVLVPGEHLATLGALRERVAAQLHTVPSSVILLLCDHKSVLIMEEDQDHRSLGKGYGIKPGDLVFAEIRSPPTAAVESEVQDSPTGFTTDSLALLALRKQLSSITVLFNDPRAISKRASDEGSGTVDLLKPDSNGTKHKHSVRVSSHVTLKQLKVIIAIKLQMDLDKDIFYMVKSDSPAAPQYKDDTLSLYESGLRDLSAVHLRLGEGCALGEHFFLFECEVDAATTTSSSSPSSSYLPDSEASKDALPSAHSQPKKARNVFVTQMAVQELLTVLQLKELLLVKWGALVPMGEGPRPPTPHSPHHIRLRDAKVPGSSGLGTFLRNERVLSRCLLGLTDGRKIVVQVLRDAEMINPLDWILSVRVVTYSLSESSDTPEGGSGCPLGEYAGKRVHKAVDLPLSRSATVRQLYQIILDNFPHLKETSKSPSDPTHNSDTTETVDPFPERHLLSIAKGFSSGPPLTLKSSLRSTWDTPVMTSSPDLKIDHISVGLRDGVLLLIRSAADWQRAISQDPSLLQCAEGMGEMKFIPSRAPMKPLAPWKAKAVAGKKTAAELGLGAGILSCEKVRVEKGLKLGTGTGVGSGSVKVVGGSRQASQMQCALELDSRVNTTDLGPIGTETDDTKALSPTAVPPKPTIYSEGLTLSTASDESDALPGLPALPQGSKGRTTVEVVRALKEGLDGV